MADYNIPLDVQEEIIKRLPIKSLIRFTSVSKPWKSFIQSSKFIAGYRQTQHLFVSYYEDTYSTNDIKYVSVIDDDTYPVREFSFMVPTFVNLVSCSQGLFCFYNSYSGTHTRVILWNPTIRKSVDIVVPNVSHSHHYSTTVGFGVCPQTCDPKLVKINSVNEIPSKSSIPCQVDVFTLSSGVWRSLSTNLPRKSLLFSENHVDIDGFIYWRVADRFYRADGRLWWNNMIMSFDMKGTEFAEIYLPVNLSNYYEICVKIYVLWESLVVLEWNRMAAEPVYGVWMMDNGDSKSFTKLYAIESPDGSSITKVLGFTKSGKPIIVMKKDRYEPGPDALSVYEPNTKEINHIGISGKRTIRFAISYTETLLLLDH